MKVTCMAIDDEPLALKQMSGYIKQTPFLELVAECQSAFEAMEILRNKAVQLLFVDINMPDLNGMDFVKSISDRPYIIFTTAYSEYAIEGFDVDASDYLLKPISFPRFLKAADKVRNLIELIASNKPEDLKATADYLFVKSDYKLMRIDLADIKYIEGMHEYIRIYLVTGKPVMTLLSMKNMEDQLPPHRFMRVHRSYIVNLSKVSVIERNRILFDGTVYIPVGDQYKASFQQYIDKNTRQI